MSNPNPSPATRFKKGEHLVGRAKGVPNVRTAEVRAVLHEAATQLGGLARLVAWAREDPINERIFWSQMYMSLMPRRVEGTLHAEFEHTVDVGDLSRLLEANGLPATLLGRDAPPTIDLDPVSNMPAKLSQECPLSGQSKEGDVEK
jgi:hypothetical protein